MVDFHFHAGRDQKVSGVKVWCLFDPAIRPGPPPDVDFVQLF